MAFNLEIIGKNKEVTENWQHQANDKDLLLFMSFAMHPRTQKIDFFISNGMKLKDVSRMLFQLAEQLKDKD